MNVMILAEAHDCESRLQKLEAARTALAHYIHCEFSGALTGISKDSVRFLSITLEGQVTPQNSFISLWLADSCPIASFSYAPILGSGGSNPGALTTNLLN